MRSSLHCLQERSDQEKTTENGVKSLDEAVLEGLRAKSMLETQSEKLVAHVLASAYFCLFTFLQ